MSLRKLRQWDAAPTAARPHLVVVLPPCCNCRARLRLALEPVLVQALVAGVAIEALDEAVLHWLAWLDQDVTPAVGLRPGDGLCSLADMAVAL